MEEALVQTSSSAVPPARPTFVTGHRERTRRAGPFVLTERDYAPGLRTPRHEHEYASIDLVIRGAAADSYRRRSREAGTGAVLSYLPQAAHTWATLGGAARLLHLIVPAALLGETDGNGDRDLDEREPATTRAPGLAFRMLREFRRRDDASILAIESLGMELLGELLAWRDPASTPPAWLDRVTAMLCSDSAATHDLGRLAAEVDVHPGHLARTFRTWHHCSPGEYLRSLRLASAASTLTRTRRSLGRVALDAGFTDQAHFCHAFKRRYGVSPGAYRRTLAAC